MSVLQRCPSYRVVPSKAADCSIIIDVFVCIELLILCCLFVFGIRAGNSL